MAAATGTRTTAVGTNVHNKAATALPPRPTKKLVTPLVTGHCPWACAIRVTIYTSFANKPG